MVLRMTSSFTAAGSKVRCPQVQGKDYQSKVRKQGCSGSFKPLKPFLHHTQSYLVLESFNLLTPLSEFALCGNGGEYSQLKSVSFVWLILYLPLAPTFCTCGSNKELPISRPARYLPTISQEFQLSLTMQNKDI